MLLVGFYFLDVVHSLAGSLSPCSPLPCCTVHVEQEAWLLYRSIIALSHAGSRVDTDWHCDGQEHKGYLDLNVLRESCYSASSRAKRKEDTRPLVAVSIVCLIVRSITIDFVCYMHIDLTTRATLQ